MCRVILLDDKHVYVAIVLSQKLQQLHKDKTVIFLINCDHRDHAAKKGYFSVSLCLQEKKNVNTYVRTYMYTRIWQTQLRRLKCGTFARTYMFVRSFLFAAVSSRGYVSEKWRREIFIFETFTRKRMCRASFSRNSDYKHRECTF